MLIFRRALRLVAPVLAAMALAVGCATGAIEGAADVPPGGIDGSTAPPPPDSSLGDETDPDATDDGAPPPGPDATPGPDAHADTGAGDAKGDVGVDAPIDTGTDAGNCTTVAPNNLCGLVPQCGCGANQTCDVNDDVTGATVCANAGAVPQGSFCAATTDCALGLTCVRNACRPYCTTANQPCPGAGLGECFDPQTASGATTPNRHVCAITCDVRVSSAVCGNNACRIFTGNVTDCRKPGTKTQDQGCANAGDPTDCAADFMCDNDVIVPVSICMRWCRIGGSDCGGGYTCRDFYGPNAPTSGGVRLGVCD